MTILCLVQTALLCLILWRLGRLEGQSAAPSQSQEPPNPPGRPGHGAVQRRGGQHSRL